MKAVAALRATCVFGGGVLAVALTMPVATSAARAQAQATPPANVPLPPRRPADIPAVTAPEAAAPSPAPVQQPAASPADTSDPPATRAQLRACSLEWQKMKKSGEAYGMIWRDFAKTCIPRQEP
jgi:hypothetical protein